MGCVTFILFCRNLNDWIELTTYVTPPEPAAPIPHLPLPAALDYLGPLQPPSTAGAPTASAEPAPGSAAAAVARGQALSLAERLRAQGLPQPPTTPTPATTTTTTTTAVAPAPPPPTADATIFDTLRIRKVPTYFAEPYAHAGTEKQRLPALAADSPTPIPLNFPDPARPPERPKFVPFRLQQPDVRPSQKGRVFHLPPLPPNSRLPITLLMHAHLFKFHAHKWQFSDELDIGIKTTPPPLALLSHARLRCATHLMCCVSRSAAAACCCVVQMMRRYRSRPPPSISPSKLQRSASSSEPVRRPIAPNASPNNTHKPSRYD